MHGHEVHTHLRPADDAVLRDAPEASAPDGPARRLRYRELFTGRLPYRAKLETWTLVLFADAKMLLEHDRADALENSLRVGVARPFGPLNELARERFTGTWGQEPGGGVRLAFDDGARAPVRCRSERVAVLAAGALLVVPPHAHAPWRPAARLPVDVLACERAWLAAPASWTDEPQPQRLLFAALPGVEYAHENDDMVVQQGGLRRIEP
jgi:hypothetical protein